MYAIRSYYGVTDKRYKLIRFYGKDVPGGGEWELYDLEKDPSEMNNVYDNQEYAEIVVQLKKELANLRVKYKVNLD